jgi:hypothetical protein
VDVTSYFQPQQKTNQRLGRPKSYLRWHDPLIDGVLYDQTEPPLLEVIFSLKALRKASKSFLVMKQLSLNSQRTLKKPLSQVGQAEQSGPRSVGEDPIVSEVFSIN